MTKNNKHIVNAPHAEKAEPIYETQAQRHLLALKSAFLSCFMPPDEHEQFLEAFQSEFEEINVNAVFTQQRRDVLNDFESRQAQSTHAARSADSELKKTQTYAPKRPARSKGKETVMTFAPAFSLFHELPHTQSSSSQTTSVASISTNSVPHSSIDSVMQYAQNILRKRLYTSFTENAENVNPNTVTTDDNTSDLTTASENSSVASDSDMPQTKRYKR